MVIPGLHQGEMLQYEAELPDPKKGDVFTRKGKGFASPYMWKSRQCGNGLVLGTHSLCYMNLGTIYIAQKSKDTEGMD